METSPHTSLATLFNIVGRAVSQGGSDRWSREGPGRICPAPKDCLLLIFKTISAVKCGLRGYHRRAMDRKCNQKLCYAQDGDHDSSGFW